MPGATRSRSSGRPCGRRSSRPRRSKRPLPSQHSAGPLDRPRREGGKAFPGNGDQQAALSHEPDKQGLTDHGGIVPPAPCSVSEPDTSDSRWLRAPGFCYAARDLPSHRGGDTGPMADVSRAVILAPSPDALTPVAGVPLAVRAVLALSAAGVGEIALLAGARETELRLLLDRRGLGPRVAWLASPDDAAPLADGGPVLVLTADILFDGAALAPLLATAGAGEPRVTRAVTPRGGLRVVLCPAPL